jgi:hypothetical protein
MCRRSRLAVSRGVERWRQGITSDPGKGLGCKYCAIYRWKTGFDNLDECDLHRAVGCITVHAYKARPLFHACLPSSGRFVGVLWIDVLWKTAGREKQRTGDKIQKEKKM